MERKQNWLGWIAIGIGTLALLAVFFGPGFGRQGGVAGFSNANAPQSSVQGGRGQRNDGPRGNVTGPGTNVQPGQGQTGRGSQSGTTSPGAYAERGRGQKGGGFQGGAIGPGANMGRGSDRSGGNGFGWGSWFRLPFKLISGAFQTAMLALLIILGLWFFRGRPANGRTEPAQGPSPSPTGETYTEE